jgi:hypothetical protein
MSVSVVSCQNQLVCGSRLTCAAVFFVGSTVISIIASTKISWAIAGINAAAVGTNAGSIVVAIVWWRRTISVPNSPVKNKRDNHALATFFGKIATDKVCFIKIVPV